VCAARTAWRPMRPRLRIQARLPCFFIDLPGKRGARAPILRGFVFRPRRP
jgi:hypothetical protein